MRDLGRALGLGLSPHPLRASAITLMLCGGAQLHEAQRAAGHASPATTERYIKKEAPSASSKTGIRRPPWAERPMAMLLEIMRFLVQSPGHRWKQWLV